MKSVGILVGVGVAGVFVGAMATEIIHRVRPNLIPSAEDSTKKAFGAVGKAFKDGYYGGPDDAPSEKLKDE